MEVQIKRFLEWILLAAGILLALYLNDVVNLLFKSVTTIEGTFQDTYPLGGLFLIIVFSLFRWDAIKENLLRNQISLSEEIRTRVIGLALVLLPLSFLLVQIDPVLEAGLTVMLVIYGTWIILNPRSWRLFFPYALLYVGVVLAPSFIIGVAGNQVASFESYLTSLLMAPTGIKATWNGTVVDILSKNSGSVFVGISAECTNIAPISIFVLFMSVAYLDVRTSRNFFLKFLIVGTIIFVILNPIRIEILLIAVYLGGQSLLDSVHPWMGYAIFVPGYIVALIVYLWRVGHSSSV